MFLFPVQPEVVEVAKDSVRTEMILDVFDYWRKFHPLQFQHPKSTMKEWIKVRLRMQEGYTVAQLCRAIDGMHKSPWHLGENPGGKKYLSLELCLRDAGKVEQFLECANTPDSPVLSEKTMRSARALQSWVNRGEQQ